MSATPALTKEDWLANVERAAFRGDHAGMASLLRDASAAELLAPPAGALDQAVNRCEVACARLLLEAGARPRRAHVFVAIANHASAMAQLLLLHGAPVTGADLAGAIDLYGGDALATMLAQHCPESELNKLSPDGELTPLESAAKCGAAELVRLLIHRGADPSVRNYAAAVIALHAGLQADLVGALLAGAPAIARAALTGTHAEIVQALIQVRETDVAAFTLAALIAAARGVDVQSTGLLVAIATENRKSLIHDDVELALGDLHWTITVTPRNGGGARDTDRPKLRFGALTA